MCPRQLSLKGTEFPVADKNYSKTETKKILALMCLGMKM